MKRIRIFILAAILVLGATVPVLAANGTTEQEAAAAYLREAGIMLGNESGDMMLDQGLTRAQMAALLTRVVANPEHVQADSTFYRNRCKFSDVPEWAKVYVGYCAANYLVLGYDNGLYGSNDPVTSAAACTVMLRCLEEVNVEWDYQSACRTAVLLGLASEETVADAEITRGNMAVLICRTMAQMGFEVELPAETKSEDTGAAAVRRNADGSINVPSDGSRYVPQAGDVIRCDDGTNYTITDVSRWDKNMFAGGPVGELPTPTCDWSSFPEVELPAPEVRRYQLESGDYLFIRNLYESRRMQYTLQNLAGNHPDTSENGKLKYGSKGTPAVRIQLTIDPARTVPAFWPWRESEMEKVFNSCPPGSYCMESWDVYKNGIFQRTEYQIYAL